VRRSRSGLSRACPPRLPFHASSRASSPFFRSTCVFLHAVPGCRECRVDLDDAPRRRLSTETKASFKTTEFFAYLGAVVGVLMASQLVGTEDGHDDYFRADRAWFYVVLLTIGYMVARGFAKSGSRDYYDAR
jgi:hypothetical protein